MPAVMLWVTREQRNQNSVFLQNAVRGTYTDVKSVVRTSRLSPHFLFGYRPHAYGEFGSKSGNFWIRSPEWKFLNPITLRIRVDGRIRIFSDTMPSQNWRQYLPRKFKHGRRTKANSFCAPWAYFQSFSLYAAKCRSTKCWNKLCQKAAWRQQALYVSYRTERLAETT